MCCNEIFVWFFKKTCLLVTIKRSSTAIIAVDLIVIIERVGVEDFFEVLLDF